MWVVCAFVRDLRSRSARPASRLPRISRLVSVMYPAPAWGNEASAPSPRNLVPNRVHPRGGRRKPDWVGRLGSGRLVRRSIMDITGRMERMRTGARQRMTEMKADRAESQNDQLKAENRVLRDELEETRSERQRVLDLLEKAQFTMEEPKKRRFRVFRLLLAAGAIYAVGTRTGAFQRVREWMNTMRGQMDEMAARTTEKATEAGYRLGDVVEHTGRTIQETGERVGQAGDQMEQKAKQTGTTA